MKHKAKLSKSKCLGLALLSFAGLVLLFGIPTAIIPNPWFVRMIPTKNVDYIFLLLNSGLLAAYFGVHSYAKQVGKTAIATTGGFANAFAVSCPICNKILVALLGTTAIMAYIEPLRIWLGLASLILVSAALLVKVKAIRCATC